MTSVCDHGYTRSSVPPPAAKLHSASVGRRPLSQAQKANATYQLTHVAARASFSPGTSVHVGIRKHRAFDLSSAVLAGRFEFHAESHPLAESRGCAPAPSAGALACVPKPASTKALKRPTVTSYSSNRNAPTVAGEVPRFLVAPPGTTTLRQQSSSPFEPQ